ncbi:MULTISPECIES: SDR family oxidoreductase [Tenacibaculum]|uniref:SDR family oxidoreductase n=1 Tax=Tenacibaculum TaxID=104267 RepID=UPI001F0A8A58|nr:MULTISPECIES: SDR family oxidoreductase [Tenacibaculum]MCH3880774.1 SDR family oxidoreductase [Tenacibaculum aquimarinum]MCH3884347.1 SDR family oxidoreductase [Tenacibaculum aquimarinum]MDO6599627.1 SDR family oxidoreductase [Tenacibaculum sp. 1_MG-2023]
MNLNIKNKNALVCGSTQGIGKATAMALANEGANVTLVARNEEKLKEVLAELPKDNQCHGYLVADFSKPEELKKVLETTDLKFHILINNTGGPKGGELLTATPTDLINAFQMHIVCNQILTQAVVPFMKSEKFGRIINVISTSVKEPIPGLGVSNTIRNAVGNWAKTLATELGGFQITVNNVLPGFTNTARLDQIIKIKSEKANTTEAEMEQLLKSYVPAARFAKPEETAAAVTFLASEQASYINGINLPVDGGRTKSL